MISCTSSGSSRSLIAVKPATSAKRIVTVRRSSAGWRARTAGRADAATASAPPQLPQNLNPAGLSNPHEPHAGIAAFYARALTLPPEAGEVGAGGFRMKKLMVV